MTDKKGKTVTKTRTVLAHTLNNTCVAPPRMLIAFLENNLNADGTVHIPEVLRPYMGGKDHLEKGQHLYPASELRDTAQGEWEPPSGGRIVSLPPCMKQKPIPTKIKEKWGNFHEKARLD